MERVAMVLAVVLGVLAPTSAAASVSSLSRGAAPEAVRPRVSPPPPRFVPAWGTVGARPTTDVPLPPEPVAPAPASEASAAVGPVEAPSAIEPVTEAPATKASPTIEPVTTEVPATETSPTKEPPSAVVAEPETQEAAPVSRPFVVGRPPEPLVILDPPPPPGTGMRVGGGILIGLGTLNTLIGGVLTAVAEKEERALGIARLSLGIVELGSGVALVAHGVRRARRLEAWKVQSGHTVPKTGNGMLVGGSILVGVGLYDGLVTAVHVQQTNELPVGTIAIASLEVVGGAVLLVAGSGRKRRYQRWLHESFAFTGPSVRSLPGGMVVGMRGRF